MEEPKYPLAVKRKFSLLTKLPADVECPPGQLSMSCFSVETACYLESRNVTGILQVSGNMAEDVRNLTFLEKLDVSNANYTTNGTNIMFRGFGTAWQFERLSEVPVSVASKIGLCTI